jgi:hypothetical protein
MAMDDAASLAAELLQKLAELEQKVEHHRQGMTAEFQRYSQHLLQNVSADVSARVEKAIRDSIHKYPALNPALDREHPLLATKGRLDDESPSSTRSSSNTNSNASSDTDDNNKTTDESGHPRRWASPPPVLPHRSGQPPDHSPRSPHEREREFQGLFTPSYLPLLDSRDSELASPPSLLPSPPSLPTALLPLSPAQSRELTKDPAKAEQSLLSPTTAAAARPEPIRRPTNDTLSSCASDDSTTKSRRSALRRYSSSSAKAHSPRRVRFEVEGGEVLPTASPTLSPRAAGHTLSPLAANPPSFVVSPSYDSSAVIGEEDDGLLGSSPPLPKKVTSTDRLKALARNSTEDTSKWTVVGDLQDMDEEEEALIMGDRKKSSGARVPATTRDVNTVQDQPASPAAVGDVQHIEDVMEQDEEQDDDADFEDDDDDLLEMPALSSFKGRKKFSPPDLAIPNSNHDTTPAEPIPTPANSSQTASVTASAKAESKPTAGSSSNTSFDDDEDFFGYEPDEGVDDAAAQKNKGENKPPPKYIQAEDEDEDEAGEEDDFFDEESLPTPKARDFSYSTSPGISIIKPSPASASLPSRHVNPAVGSYNGKPFTLPSVRNPEILEEAAKMGNVYTFVGSVDGRSGVDESTAYKPDTASLFSGTPKSLSERLLMEEFGESRNPPTKNAGSK